LKFHEQLAGQIGNGSASLMRSVEEGLRVNLT
jgi:hypothetical protein